MSDSLICMIYSGYVEGKVYLLCYSFPGYLGCRCLNWDKKLILSLLSVHVIVLSGGKPQYTHWLSTVVGVLRGNFDGEADKELHRLP